MNNFPSSAKQHAPAGSFFNARLIIAFIFALMTLLVVGTFAYQTVLQLTDDYGNIEHTFEVIREFDKTVVGISTGQTELRAFYLTADSSYLRTYYAKIDTVHRHLSNLQKWIASDSVQNQTLKMLEVAVLNRVQFNEGKIKAFSRGGQTQADKEYSVQKSQEFIRRIDSIVNRMESTEKQELAERKTKTTNQTNRTLLLITFGGIISFALQLIVFLFLFKEVRQRTKVEKEIRDSEKRFISFLEAVPAGVFILTADGKPFYANEEAKKILGAGIVPDTSTQNLAEVYHAYLQGTDIPYSSEFIPIVRALKGERSTISDIEIWKPDAITPLFVTGAPIYDSEGHLQYAMAAFIDISEQKRVQQQLAESETRFRQIIENASDIIYRTDELGQFTYVNPTGLTMMGYNTSEVIGKHFSLFVKEEEKQKVFRYYYKQRQNKTASSYLEFSAITKGGDVVILGQSVGLLFEKNKDVGFLAIARNVTLQKQAEEEIARRQQQLDTVITTVDEGITLSDESGRFEIFNTKMEELTGYSKDEANTGEFTKLLYPDPVEQRKGLNRLGEVVEKGFIYDVETTIKTKSGQEKILLISTRIVHVKDTVMYLSAYRDITLRKQFEEELKKAKDSAESATIAKSQFLATMSHEIRTPMNGVIGMTDLLMQTDLTPEQREYTDVIRTSGETLLTLINDILDFSKIESGKLDMEKRPIEVQSLVEETFDLVARRAVEKGLDLVYLIDPSTPAYIIGDPIRLRQILLNLTNNAIKFTEKGEVFVTVKEIQRENDITTLQFSVKDTGIGIPPEKVEKLFKAFSQVDASTTRKFGGTGLGLAISKRLVELMEGNVWVESNVGKGATFHFTIKVPTSASTDALPKKYVRGKIPELQGKRVLLVDDNVTNLNILSIQCDNWGMHPRATTSQQDALQWLKENDPFDVAVIDFHMPGMNGVDLARAIRGVRSEQSLPIVLFSSSGRSEFSETENALFAAVILKPMKQAHLYSTMIDVLAKHVHSESVRKNIEIKKVELLSNDLPLKILVAEDNLINQKLAIRLLQQLGYSTDIASNGKEAVSLIKQNRYDIVFMDLHMPEMDGLEATKTIMNASDIVTRPKIIAMTADAMSGDREKCIDAGMDDYISKPVRLDGLRDMLIHYGEMIMEQKTSNGQAVAAHIMYLRLKELLEQTDVPFMTEFVQSYPSQSEDTMHQLLSAWEKKDLVEVVFAAHKLRGLSLSFGAEELADLCKIVETNGDKNPNAISDQSIKDIEQSLHRSYDLLSATLSKLGIV
ncbi:MAG: PAS domain S-box protein [Bacteroidota bacterium]